MYSSISLSDDAQYSGSRSGRLITLKKSFQYEVDWRRYRGIYSV